MRRIGIALGVVALLAIGSVRAEAATLSVTLALDSFRDIEVPTPDFPGEFRAQQSAWGRVLFNGQLVAYYLISTEEKMHNGNLIPTMYPNPWYTIAIRSVAPSEALMLMGVPRPAAEGGGVIGSVVVATPGLGFLRLATFTLVAGTVTFTY